jgi:hypothetical protein
MATVQSLPLCHFEYDSRAWARTRTTRRIISCQLAGKLPFVFKLYYDGRSVGQSVLVPDTHLGPTTNFLPFLIIFRLSRVGSCEAPSLTRARVCNLQFLLTLASAIFLRSDSRRTHYHIFTVSNLRLPQPGRPGSCSYFRRNRVAQKLLFVKHDWKTTWRQQA